MTGPLLYVPEADGGALIDEARRLAGKLGRDREEGAPPVVAVAFDGLADPEAVAADGPAEVRHVVRDDGTFAAGAAGVSARAEALATLADDALAVLLPDTPDDVDLAAATARRLRSACITGCLLRVRDGDLVAGRPAYGGRAYAEFGVERGPPVATLDTDGFGPPPGAADGPVTVERVEVSVEDDDRVRHVATAQVPEDDLAKARRIVAGGAGLGGPDGFDLIEDLADALGAAVGASRPPADEGWVSFDRQIGVTGKGIDVELYVPCAISGDAYHLRSVDADVLLAINADPDARIFDFADFGIVGDVYEYVPALTDAIRRAEESTDEAAAEGAE